MSFYLTFVGLLLLAAAALGALVARTSGIPRSARYLIPAAALGVALTIVGTRPGPPTVESEDQRAIERIGAQLIDSIESYRRATGRLPRDLGALRGITPGTPRGAFFYTPGRDSASYELRLGDLDQDHFEVRWSSEEPRGEWQWVSVRTSGG